MTRLGRSLGRAVGRRGEQLDVVYHVTLARNLHSIARFGLAPSRGTGHGVGKGGYARWSKGKVFLTDAVGVLFWHGRVEDHAEHEYGDELSDAAAVPVVLRIRNLRRLLHDDTVAAQEGTLGAYYVRRPIPSRQVEVFDGDGWVSVSKYLDREEVESYVGQHLEKHGDDDDTWESFRTVVRRFPGGPASMDSTMPPELWPVWSAPAAE